MVLAAGSDSTCNLTEVITDYLESEGHTLIRIGALDGEQADYVDAARGVAEAVSQGVAEQGVLFCNTGTGVTIVANKVPGARAALCMDAYSSSIARLANNANILVLGIRLTGEKLAIEIVDSWLNTQPSDEPRRVRFHEKTDEVERNSRESRVTTLSHTTPAS
jgi:ribose 5-phosphate isomerase B